MGTRVVDEGLLGDDGVAERWKASCLAPDQQWKEEVDAEPEDGISKRLRKEERSPFRGDDVVLPKDSRVCNNSR